MAALALPLCLRLACGAGGAPMDLGMAAQLDSGQHTRKEPGGLIGEGVDSGSSRGRRRGFSSVQHSDAVILCYLHT
jgi:hypothetical protein